MKTTPLQQVKEKFGSKDKLVDKLMGLLKRPASTTKDQFKKRLRAQSNRKLMILLTRQETIKEKHGSREKLIDALVNARMGKAQKEDKGYRIGLEKKSNGQLLDIARRNKL